MSRQNFLFSLSIYLLYLIIILLLSNSFYFYYFVLNSLWLSISITFSLLKWSFNSPAWVEIALWGSFISKVTSIQSYLCLMIFIVFIYSNKLYQLFISFLMRKHTCSRRYNDSGRINLVERGWQNLIFTTNFDAG